jgi:hypothetical protein
VLEERVLEKPTHKPLCWCCYVADTFVIWQHGVDKLKTFLEFLNSIHKKIQFTMEMEEEEHPPFLDISVYRRPGSTLGHRIYRKAMHSNLYLHLMSHHRPSNKHAVLATLMFRARAICDEDSLGQELEFLKTSFRENG